MGGKARDSCGGKGPSREAEKRYLGSRCQRPWRGGERVGVQRRRVQGVRGRLGQSELLAQHIFSCVTRKILIFFLLFKDRKTAIGSPQGNQFDLNANLKADTQSDIDYHLAGLLSLYSATIFWTFLKLDAGSQDVSCSPQPCHLTRYFVVLPSFFLSMISSTM